MVRLSTSIIIASLASVLCGMMILIGEVHAQDPASPVLPVTSVSVSQGVTYITDSKQFVWYRVGSGAWQRTDGLGWGISAYGTSGLAVVGTSSHLFIRNIVGSGSTLGFDTWVDKGGLLITKTGGNRQGSLWLMTSQSILFEFDFASGVFPNDKQNVGSVIDFAVRDKVYVLQGNQICARSLTIAVTERDCVTPPFSPAIIAASDSNLFAITAEGVLYSMVLPLSPSSVFFDTGFRSAGPKFLTVPLDGNAPIIIDGSGNIVSDFCSASAGISCFAPPVASTSTTTTETPTSTTANPTTTSDASTTTATTIVSGTSSSSVSTTLTTSTAQPSNTSASSTSSSEGSSSNPLPAILGAAGAAFLIAIVVIAVIVVRNTRRAGGGKRFSNIFLNQQGGQDGYSQGVELTTVGQGLDKEANLPKAETLHVAMPNGAAGYGQQGYAQQQQQQQYPYYPQSYAAPTPPQSFPYQQQQQPQSYAYNYQQQQQQLTPDSNPSWNQQQQSIPVSTSGHSPVSASASFPSSVPFPSTQAQVQQPQRQPTTVDIKHSVVNLPEQNQSVVGQTNQDYMADDAPPVYREMTGFGGNAERPAWDRKG
ncbi:hypothetical protein HDU97_008802 [Phlyctochytrium planicorne]|nr:hypothetical protein HDU97_008802 [Phlyctochytrium planicorne]